MSLWTAFQSRLRPRWLVAAAPACGRWVWLSLLWLGVWSAAADPAVGMRIVTSFYPIHIAALNVAHAIPGVAVINMAPPSAGCLHDYQLTPADLVTLAQAQVLVINGAGMESFLDKARAQFPALPIIDASAGIELMQGPAGVNPHVWLSVSHAMTQVRTLARELARLDPEHAAQYAENAAVYLEQLEALRVKIHAGLQGLRTREIVTFHEAFPYFAAEFDLRIVGVIEREPGASPSARDLAQLIELLRRRGIKALFAEPQYSAKAAETIARETGAIVYTLDSAVTGPLRPEAYLTIMEDNLRQLQQALR